MIQSNIIYIFICSNVPVPRTMQFSNFFESKGMKSMTFFLNRNMGLVSTKNTESLFGFNVRFKPLSLKRVISIVKFYFYIKKTLKTNSPNSRYIFHSDSLDMYLISLFLKRQYKGKLVLEIRDLHKVQFSFFGKIFLRHFERFIFKYLDHLILTSPGYHSYYNKVFFKRVHLIENVPNLEISKIKYRSNEGGELIIGYVGVVRYPKQILNLVNAIKETNKEGTMIRLKIWGGIPPWIRNDLLNAIEKVETIEYLGPYIYNLDIYKIFESFDILYSVYDTNYKNVSLAIPNKYYESILFRKPIIVAADTYLSSMVEHSNIGVSIDCNSTKELIDAISKVNINEANWYTTAKRKLENENPIDLQLSFEAAMNNFCSSLMINENRIVGS